MDGEAMEVGTETEKGGGGEAPPPPSWHLHELPARCSGGDEGQGLDAGKLRAGGLVFARVSLQGDVGEREPNQLSIFIVFSCKYFVTQLLD